MIERRLRGRDRALEDALLPESIFASPLPGLSHEVKEKLARLKPATLGHAARIAGINPPDVALLAVHIERHRRATSGEAR